VLMPNAWIAQIHYHQLNVYHPSSGQGHAFASLSWSGFIGSITGFSDQLAICEKVRGWREG
jgi:hypothetical protein